MVLNFQLMTNPAARLVFCSSVKEALGKIKHLTRDDYEISDFVCPISELNPRFVEKWLEKRETIEIGPYTLRMVECENSARQAKSWLLADGGGQTGLEDIGVFEASDQITEGSGELVLVVDDLPDMRNLIGNSLTW
jgi:hypothetical protein